MSGRGRSWNCRIALNLIRQETTVKAGMKAKRLKAACSDRYLMKVLNGA
jgi:hypothetical protein